MEANTETARIHSMLSGVMKHLQRIFKERFKQKTGCEWNNTGDMGEYYLHRIDRLERCSAEKRLMIRTGDASRWDLSTLITAINSIRLPNSKKMQREDEHIRSIKTIRNSLAHLTEQYAIKLDPTTFNQYFKVLSSAFYYFGEKKVDVEKYKTSDLSEFSDQLSKQAEADRAFEMQQALIKGALKTKDFRKALNFIGKAIQSTSISERQRGFMCLKRSDVAVEWLNQRKTNAKNAPGEEEEENLVIRALADLKRAHQILSEDADDYLAKKARLLVLKGEPTNAIKIYARALEKDPTNETLLRERSVLLYDESVRGEKLTSKRYFSDDISEREASQEFYEAKNAASKGDRWGMRKLANCYAGGSGTPRDPVKAASVWEQLANLPERKKDGSLCEEVVRGQHHFGYCLYDGHGVPQDIPRGVEYIKKAANNGYEISQLFMGEWYLKAKHVPLDREKGFKLVLGAAMKGYLDGMWYAAHCYLSGVGTQVNHREAVKWLERAAKRNDHKSAQLLEKLKTDILPNCKPNERIRFGDTVFPDSKPDKALPGSAPMKSLTGNDGVKFQQIHETFEYSDTINGLTLKALSAGKFSPEDADILVETLTKASKIHPSMIVFHPKSQPMLIKMVDSVYSEKNTENSIYCKSMLAENPAEAISILKLGVKKYPSAVLLWQTLGDKLYSEKIFDEALVAVNTAIDIGTSRLAGALLSRGRIYWCMAKYDEALPGLDLVIKQVAADAPESLESRMLAASCCIHKNDWQSARSHYEAAVSVLKDPMALALLDTVRPDMLQQVEDALRKKFTELPALVSSQVLQKMLPGGPDTEEPQPMVGESDRTMMVDHRTMFFNNMVSKKLIVSSLPASSDTNTTGTQIVPADKSSLASTCRKKIFLREIDWAVEHTEKGKFLMCTVITRPIDAPGLTMTIVQDRKGECMPLVFTFFVQLKVGTKLIIYNPAIVPGKQFGYGSAAIVVSDPISFVVKASVYENICWYCGVPDSELPLKKCGKCPAHYCSKECQVNDWKILNHKSVCFP